MRQLRNCAWAKRGRNCDNKCVTLYVREKSWLHECVLCACETIATKEGKFFCVVGSRLISHDELQIGSKDRLIFTLCHRLSTFFKVHQFFVFYMIFHAFLGKKKRKVDVPNQIQLRISWKLKKTENFCFFSLVFQLTFLTSGRHLYFSFNGINLFYENVFLK